jgi:hypothetical protein
MFVPTETVTPSSFIRYEVWASLRGCLVRTDHLSGRFVRELEVVASSSMEAAALAFDAYRGESLPDSTILTVILGGKTMTWDAAAHNAKQPHYWHTVVQVKAWKARPSYGTETGAGTGGPIVGCRTTTGISGR